jgi:signal transduction histidine kinase
MHDQFGEQLTALSLRIALLRDACGERADLANHVAALAEIAERLDRDVDQLVWELRPTALDDLGLRAALANYIHEWSERTGIAAELHTSGLLDERLGSEVETALYRIAQEALNNAAKHSHATRLKLSLYERDGRSVVLAIRDNGVGLPANGNSVRGFGVHFMRYRAGMIGATLDLHPGPEGGTVLTCSISRHP